MYSTSKYDKSKTISILNARQAAFYWNNGLQPIDIFPSRDMITNAPVMVFVFNREDTKELFNQWCELKKESQTGGNKE